MDTCTHKIVLKKNSQGQIIFLKKKAFCKIKVYRSLKKNKNTKLLADKRKKEVDRKLKIQYCKDIIIIT